MIQTFTWMFHKAASIFDRTANALARFRRLRDLLNEIGRLTGRACAVFMRTCVVFMRACVVFMSVSVVFMSASVVFMHACAIFMRACVVFMRGCAVFMRARAVFMGACAVFMRFFIAIHFDRPSSRLNGIQKSIQQVPWGGGHQMRLLHRHSLCY